jgi:Fe-S-cluster-containing hydrogenase component 2
MVEINETCIDYERCHNYCPVKAISSDGNGMSIVDFDACVECGTCYRAGFSARVLGEIVLWRF